MFDFIKIDWVEIPASNFKFGLSEEQAAQLLVQLPPDNKRIDYIKRQLQKETDKYRLARLQTYYISRYPITNQQYTHFAVSEHPYSDKNIFTSQNGHPEPHGDIILQKITKNHEANPTKPVMASWHSAFAFCNWLGARLPTSAEWEKAARGTDDRLYPWGNSWNASRGHFSRDDGWGRHPCPVDAHPSGASPYGVMDMCGNCFEWTMVGGHDLKINSPTEQMICRGSSTEVVDTTSMPAWLAGRVTAISPNYMYGPGFDYVGFRPVLDKWHQRYHPAYKLA